MFASQISDWDGMKRSFSGLRERFGPSLRVETLATYLRGLAAYALRDYELAAAQMESARANVWSRTVLSRSYQFLAAAKWEQREDREALELARLGSGVRPENPIAIYNVAVLEWFLEHQIGSATSESSWRPRLELFAEKAVEGRSPHKQAIRVAQQVLSGDFRGRPALLLPREPSRQDGVQARDLMRLLDR